MTTSTQESYLKKFLNMASLVPPGVVGVVEVDVLPDDVVGVWLVGIFNFKPLR